MNIAIVFAFSFIGSVFAMWSIFAFAVYTLKSNVDGRSAHIAPLYALASAAFLALAHWWQLSI